MMKPFKFILTILLGLTVFLADAQEHENYIKTYIAREPGLTELTSENDENKVSRISQYFDDLGRPIQRVIRRGSPSLKDVITVTGYDGYGRADRQYLPYTISRLEGEDGNYDAAYEANVLGFYTDPYHFTSTVYELSPLNRVASVYGPGNAWRYQGGDTQDRPVSYVYETNTSVDVIPYFDVNNSEDQLITFNGNYEAGTLWIAGTKDEDSHEALEYTDKFGRVVARRIDPSGIDARTYYIYDDYGNLTFVLPPEAVSSASSNWESNLNNATFRENWLFRYRYDKRGRMIEKQVPGAAMVEMVYDKRDRLVFTLDGNRRSIGSSSSNVEFVESGTKTVTSYEGKSYVRAPGARIVLKKPGFQASKLDNFSVQKSTSADPNEWLYTKYDALNRPVITGIKPMVASRADLQAAMDTTTNYDFSVSYIGTTSGNIHGYDNTSYPSASDTEVLSVTYYDDYLFIDDQDWEPNNDGSYSHVGHSTQTQGLVTGGLSRVLGSSPERFLKSVAYYDDRLRPEATITENYFSGADKVVTTYRNDVSSLVSRTVTTHIKEGLTTTVTENFLYDHMDRLLTHTHQINGNGVKTLVSNTYNEIGQLIEKDLDDPNDPVQSVDYSYNIRGWLSTINGGADNLDTQEGDQFGLTLKYQDAPNAQYNGNIGQMLWQSMGGGMTEVSQNYQYAYDNLNRLKSANYTGVGNFDVSNISYDKNGNIQTLQRNTIDNLDYDYIGNQLTRVEDATSNTQGFKDVSSAVGTQEYRYDKNGNMISDTNKGITAITYNYLNLPQQVTLNTGTNIHYTYDAAGIKHQKVADDGSPDTTTYIGGFHYTNGDLKFLQHAEGRALKSGTIWTYEYNLTDHLGNIRVSVDESGSVVQRDGYYPFGGAFNSWHVSPKNHYMYQGKEEQQELDTYDFHARMYDPMIGRTFQIDPMADKYYFFSPYSWVANNPILVMDPSGMTLDYSHLEKSDKKAFKKALRDLRKSGDTGKSLVKFLKSKDAGRVILTAEEGEGGSAGSFVGNEWTSVDLGDFGSVKEYTNEEVQTKYFSENEDEKGGVLNIDLDFANFAGADPMEILVEEAAHAGNYAAAVDENGSNVDINLASGDDEAAAKAVVGQVEHESGRGFMMFSNDAGIRKWGVGAFSSKSAAGFGSAARNWKASQTSRSYKQKLVRGRVPSFLRNLIKR